MESRDLHTFYSLVVFLLTTTTESLTQISTTTVYACQGGRLSVAPCPRLPNQRVQLKVKSIIVLTSSNTQQISEQLESNLTTCVGAERSKTIARNYTDLEITTGYTNLYQWTVQACERRDVCVSNERLPQWWQLVENNTSTDLQYFTAAILVLECWVASEVGTLGLPPYSNPQQSDLTTTSSTLHTAVVPIYRPELGEMTAIVLAVGIPFSFAILLTLVILLYYCEKSRKHKRLAKRHRMLGGPQANKAFTNDEIDLEKPEGWSDSAPSGDALAEFIGVKPEEFLTFDKRAMENTGQILRIEMTY